MRANSLTSGARSPTKIEYSGPRSSRLFAYCESVKLGVYTRSNPGWDGLYLRSASPPPEAQFSLKGRLEFGIGWPLRCNAFAAASELVKSTKQYPALLLWDSGISHSSRTWENLRGCCSPGKFVTDHLHINLLTHIVPDTANEVLVYPWLKLSHPVIAKSAKDLLDRPKCEMAQAPITCLEDFGFMSVGMTR